ncbi:MAG: hypothetical protein ABIS86_21120 [Streptosporangiaceae bacterium]
MSSRVHRFRSGSTLHSTPLTCLITAALVTLTACGNNPPKNSGSFNPAGTTAPGSAPPSALATGQPTTSIAEIDKTVLARYREYQDTYKKVYADGDPAPLTDIAIDPLLGIITKDVEAVKRQGRIWRFTNLLNPKIKNRSKDLKSVVVIDCVRTLGAYVFSAKTGKRLPGGGRGGTYVYQARFRYDGVTWKIAEAQKGKKC